MNISGSTTVKATVEAIKRGERCDVSELSLRMRKLLVGVASKSRVHTDSDAGDETPQLYVRDVLKVTDDTPIIHWIKAIAYGKEVDLRGCSEKAKKIILSVRAEVSRIKPSVAEVEECMLRR